MSSGPRGTREGGGEYASDPVSPRVQVRTGSVARLLILTLCAGLAFAGFAALGTWQVQRLHWKLDLIARVEQRVHAAAVAAPGPALWPRINAASDEYRHVRVTGTFLYELTTPVQASTELGSGFWLLTPLRGADGSVVLVNRGFVRARNDARDSRAPGNRTPATHATDKTTDNTGEQHGRLGTAAAAGDSSVTGLLRMSEPRGGFLRYNDPANNRWYSRDVQAIAAARGLPRVAPFFVDADASQVPAGESAGDASPDRPIGGLTVIAFHNNHLVYAFTWYALALMVAGGYLWVVREERKLLRGNRIDRETEDAREN